MTRALRAPFVIAFAFIFSIATAEARPRQSQVYEYEGTVLGGRPAGCPWRYCGCGLSLKIFGEIIPRLNLAWNWARDFRRASHPAPYLVAVRPGHIMQLLSHVDGDLWLVFDPNSGGGKTREHVRSVRGYIFVDPNVKVAGL